MSRRKTMMSDALKEEIAKANTNATNRIIIIGSLNFSKKRTQSEVFSGGVKMFAP